MKSLIVYFTMDGHTKAVVDMIRAYTKADTFRVERAIPYDPDYQTYAYGEAREECEQDIHPAIRQPLPDIEQYDCFIVAVPIWWYTIPMPVATFLETYPDWHRKRIYVFANAFHNDRKQFYTTVEAVRKNATGADVVPGLYNREIRGLKKWLSDHGFEVGK